jgi:hypothetical protein
MRTLFKILLVPAVLTGGAANAAPANVPLNERDASDASAGTEVTQVYHRHRHWRHGYYYRPYRYYHRPYYRPYRYYYRPYGYYHRPYYYHPRRYYGPRVRFHLGIGF